MRAEEYESEFLLISCCCNPLCSFVNLPRWYLGSFYLSKSIKVCPYCGSDLIEKVGKVRIHIEKRFLRKAIKTYSFIPGRRI